MKNQNTLTADKNVRKIGSLIEDIKVAMMVTEDHGTLRGRPMMSQEMDFDGNLWFFSNDHAAKTDEIAHTHAVQLSYAEPRKNTYISISGVADIVHDRDKAAQLWKPAYKSWFPDGLNDPRLALIRVRATQAEYWDGPTFQKVNLS